MVLGEEYCHYDIRERQSINKFPYQLYYKGDKGMLAELQHLDESVFVLELEKASFVTQLKKET